MDSRERELAGGKIFETAAEENLSRMTPDGDTAWKKSMNRILAGMVLTSITLDFWCLGYILPAVGTVLKLLGFRALRDENRWFRNCFYVSCIRAVYFFLSLIFNTTIISYLANVSQLMSVLMAVNAIFLLAESVFLRRGFISVQQNAGLSPHAGGVMALLLWQVSGYLLAVIRYSGFFIAAAMVIGYIFIIRNLCKLSQEIDAAGYSVCAVPVKARERCIAFSLGAVLLAGFVCGYTFGGSYPMKWAAPDADEHADVSQIKSHLISLGFPEDVLNDLSARDIAACDGALEVVVDVTDEPVNKGRTVTTEYGNSDYHHTVQKTVYDVRELRVTGVGVRIPGKRERWIIFHHFLWTVDPGFYGTECIQLWPVYRDISEGWQCAGDVTGRILAGRDGNTLVSDYYFLGTETFTSGSFLGGNQKNTDVFAAFSMPRGSERQRGYIAYPVDEVQDGYIISSWFNYTHQNSWLQYPAITAMEKRMENGWHDAGAFTTIQDALQFYPTDEGIEMIN